MQAKYSFQFTSSDPHRKLPGKMIFGQQSLEPLSRVVLKLFSYLLFHRERLVVETNLHMENIPFTPALVELDYELRPKLWIECGECSIQKLKKLAVKVPDAEIWIMKGSSTLLETFVTAMERAELRQQRYHLAAFDAEAFQEVCERIGIRNELYWVSGSLETKVMQFDLNGLWFEVPFITRIF